MPPRHVSTLPRFTSLSLTKFEYSTISTVAAVSSLCYNPHCNKKDALMATLIPGMLGTGIV
jgi:hypothetical protein